jgi:transcriptional regulator of acetoin/glycerol metabolism
VRVNVRVIAPTNRELKAATANGTFRLDLFYRLNVFPIQVPPLRERKNDWPGNIRELQNVVERSVILSSGDVLSVEAALVESRGRIAGPTGAAAKLRVPRSTLEFWALPAAQLSCCGECCSAASPRLFYCNAIRESPNRRHFIGDKYGNYNHRNRQDEGGPDYSTRS